MADQTTTTSTEIETVTVPNLSISDITEVKIDGSGILDKLLTLTKIHLKDQWDSGRITGHEYATVYTETFGQALSSAIQIADDRSKLAYSIKSMEADNELKQAQLDLAKQQLQRLPAEIDQIKAQTAAVIYDTQNKAPAEVANLVKQGLLVDAQVKSANFEVDQKAPKELELLSAQTDTARKEIDLRTAQVDMAKAELTSKLPVEVALMQAQVDEATYNNKNKLPIEVSNLTKQGSLMNAQVSNSAKELELKSVQVSMAQSELDNKMPVEIAYLNAQKDAMVQATTKVPYEIELLKQQQAMQIAETTLTNSRNDTIIAEAAKIPVEVEILRKNSLRSDAEIQLVNKQIESATLENSKIPYQIEVIKQQTTEAVARTAQVTSQTARLDKELTDKFPLEVSLLTKQATSMDSEVELNQSRVRLSKLEETKVPTQIEYMQAQIANMGKQNLILERDYDLKADQIKIMEKQLVQADTELSIKQQELEVAKSNVRSTSAQASLYEQKVLTEKAQVDGTVIGTDSVLDGNRNILKQQAKAYELDAKNRMLKVMTDMFAATYTGGDRSANSDNLLTDKILGNVVKDNLTALGIPST